MRMTCSRILVPLLMAMMISGIAPAKAESPPAEADEARQHERYVIQPGTESLFGDMLGQGETLAGGCTLSDGKIDRTSVLATYTCGGTPIALRLGHPASAPPQAVRTQRFAVTVESGSPPAGLVDAVAGRIRARETAFEWTEVGNGSTAPRRWPRAVAAGAVVAMLALWALRRRGAKRTRSQ